MSYLKLNIKRSALTAAVALSLVAGAAVAKGPFGHKGGGYNSPIERMIENLDLTDEQIEQVDALMESRSGKQAARAKNRAEIQELISQGAVDQAAEQAANAARARVYDRVEFQNSLSQILTPEQLAKMEKRKARKQKRAQRRLEKSSSGADS